MCTGNLNYYFFYRVFNRNSTLQCTEKFAIIFCANDVDRVKRIGYLSPMRAAHTSSESRGTFRQKARSLAPLNGLACAVKICHDGMLEETNQAMQLYISNKFQCKLSNVTVYLKQISMQIKQCNCTSQTASNAN